MLYYHYDLFTYLVARFIGSLFSWEAVVAIATTAMVIFIYQQAKATRESVETAQKSAKFLEYQIRPKAYPLLITAKERWPQDHGDSKKTIFAVINPDNFKSLFYTRIKLICDEKILNTNDSHWEKNPLHVYPGGMLYPEVFGIENLSEYENKNIVAKIEYKIAPSNAPSEVFDDYQEETWTFKEDKERKTWFWVGPNGIGPNVVKRLIDHNRNS